MLFNSVIFALFLPVVFALYWLLQRRRLAWQNAFLLVASYVFYGWWDWRFLGLIFLSSVVDYVVGLRLGVEERPRARKLLLTTSLVFNLGMLGFFKYFGFFIDSFADMLGSIGMQANLPALRFILPVGISFYTFQTLSYSLDVYRRQLEPTRDPIAFFAFVSFFPQLVAGPIERASNLLPQFLSKRHFDIDLAKDGLRQMLWGFAKKVIIADNLARYVNTIYSGSAHADGVTLAIGTFLFAIQIYSDFSGYSDIAIGTARLFGFSLMRNFAYPYFSRDIAEFWRRWHISLSSWFRDYLYIPLGGSRVPRARYVWNIVVTFTVSGFWHGANWTFILWGLLNGLYYIPLMLVGKQKEHTDQVAEGRMLPTLREFGAMLVTFAMANLAWVFFRAKDVSQAFQILKTMVVHPWQPGGHAGYLLPVGAALGLLLVEWVQRDKQHVLDIRTLPVPARWAVYYAVVAAVVVLGYTGRMEFIYFQF